MSDPVFVTVFHCPLRPGLRPNAIAHSFFVWIKTLLRGHWGVDSWYHFKFLHLTDERGLELAHLFPGGRRSPSSYVEWASSLGKQLERQLQALKFFFSVEILQRTTRSPGVLRVTTPPESASRRHFLLLSWDRVQHERARTELRRLFSADVVSSEGELSETATYTL